MKNDARHFHASVQWPRNLKALPAVCRRKQGRTRQRHFCASCVGLAIRLNFAGREKPRTHFRPTQNVYEAPSMTKLRLYVATWPSENPRTSSRSTRRPTRTNSTPELFGSVPCVCCCRRRRRAAAAAAAAKFRAYCIQRGNQFSSACTCVLVHTCAHVPVTRSENKLVLIWSRQPRYLFLVGQSHLHIRHTSLAT